VTSSNNFDELNALYSEHFKIHGVSSDAMLMPKGRHLERYQVVTDILSALPGASILDYGCGLGFLLSHLRKTDLYFEYHGVDLNKAFIESCKQRFGIDSNFSLVGPNQTLSDKFDVIYASGVFNIQVGDNAHKSLEYARKRIEQLFVLARKVLIVDFLSPDVDYIQCGAQHISYSTVLKWFVPMQTRRSQLRHDYLPYEYALVMFKDDEVIRPDHVFSPFIMNS
jgi:SAM-dependent methyltransferase